MTTTTIKEIRQAAGLTQEQVAKALEIPLRSLQNWETGRTKPPSYVERMVIEDIKRISIN